MMSLPNRTSVLSSAYKPVLYTVRNATERNSVVKSYQNSRLFDGYSHSFEDGILDFTLPARDINKVPMDVQAYYVAVYVAVQQHSSVAPIDTWAGRVLAGAEFLEAERNAGKGLFVDRDAYISMVPSAPKGVPLWHDIIQELNKARIADFGLYKAWNMIRYCFVDKKMVDLDTLSIELSHGYGLEDRILKTNLRMPLPEWLNPMDRYQLLTVISRLYAPNSHPGRFIATGQNPDCQEMDRVVHDTLFAHCADTLRQDYRPDPILISLEQSEYEDSYFNEGLDRHFALQISGSDIIPCLIMVLCALPPSLILHLISLLVQLSKSVRREVGHFTADWSEEKIMDVVDVLLFKWLNSSPDGEVAIGPTFFT